MLAALLTAVQIFWRQSAELETLLVGGLHFGIAAHNTPVPYGTLSQLPEGSRQKTTTGIELEIYHLQIEIFHTDFSKIEQLVQTWTNHFDEADLTITNAHCLSVTRTRPYWLREIRSGIWSANLTYEITVQWLA